jgi:Flp pilus assembly protein TadG
MNAKGQALVEFTLVFILIVVVAWIPADFGLAFYTGQIAQNASREGARIGAADPALASGSCSIPACYLSSNSVLQATAKRLPAALLGPATVQVTYPAAGSAGCQQLVVVSVSGQYPSFFYRVLRWFGINVSIPTISRSTSMRSEHQSTCLS